MSYKRALEADARLAARNALKIRAALRQTFDPKRVYEQYLLTQPNQSDSAAQNNARARAWVMLNVRVNMESLKEVMLRVWAEGYVTGEAFADEQLRFARERNKATDTEIDWANWQPGDRAAALLLRPPKAFQQLLDSQGITFKEFSNTTVRDIGNAIGEAIELGLPAERSAKRIMTHVANPARALSIAITEQNRAISYAQRFLTAINGAWLPESAVVRPQPDDPGPVPRPAPPVGTVGGIAVAGGAAAAAVGSVATGVDWLIWVAIGLLVVAFGYGAVRAAKLISSRYQE